jgi:preprotein translocase subunit SecD
VLPVRNPKGAPQYRLFMGQASLTGSDVKNANQSFVAGSGWTVDMSLSGDGADKFNKLAAESYPKQPPQNAVAIVLDGEVLSAPTFQTSNFAGGNVQISGSFSQSEATDLAQLIRYGALPVKLKQLTSVSVSPTLGKDQLRAGIIAGVIGLVLVMLYVLIFYRVLGLVVWFGLAMSGLMIWTSVSLLGLSLGVALTIAGVCGLIVSVGVTVDSYVVYFERLKDETRAGRTIRASVDRGFTRAFRTILIADGVSILSAQILFFLAEGNVKGFAVLLGLSVFLDILVAYFVMHPIVSIIGHKPGIVKARGIGIAAGLDAPEVEA